jgi:soluble lytic murein transglycosylase-like protein
MKLLGAMWLVFQWPLALAQGCMAHAASEFQVPLALLNAVAAQESGHNPGALRINANGSRDIGLMQINSQWLPLLRRHGLTEQDLWDPCVNSLVAAWLLARNIQRWGPTYRALGAYHSPEAHRQWRYAQQVLRRLPRSHPP